jgi:hypothetical protein
MLPPTAAASLLFTPRAAAKYASILAFGFLVSYQCRFLTAIHDEQLGGASVAISGSMEGGGGGDSRNALSFLEGSVLLSLIKSKQVPKEGKEEEEEKLLDDSYYYFDDAEDGEDEGEDKEEAKEGGNGAAHDGANASTKGGGGDVDDLELHCPTVLREQVQQAAAAANQTAARTLDGPSSGAMAAAGVEKEEGRQASSSELAKVFSKVLSESPKNSLIIDVGADAGSLSLFALAVKDFSTKALQVHALQPNRDRAVHLCESLARRNGTYPNRNVRVYALGASDHDAAKELVTLDTLATKRGWISKDATTEENRDSKINIAILRLRAPGQEVKALKGAARLLRSGLVRNVFVEVPPAAAAPDDVSGTNPSSSNLEVVLQLLVGEFKYSLVGWGIGSAGPTQRNNNQQLRQKQPRRPSDLAAAVLQDVQKHPTESVHLWFARPGAVQPKR